jgi:transcriptional regulator with XRE-family HTH domain
MLKTPQRVVGPEQLRMARLRLRLRQRDIAARVGVAPQRISDFEQGLRHPTPDQVAVLVRVLGPEIVADNTEVGG